MFVRNVANLVPAVALALGALVAGTGSASAQSSTVIIAPQPPPPPQVETVPPPPSGPTEAWQAGHWDWNGGQWAWVPGRYAAPPQPQANWVPGSWQPNESRSGYVWVPGHWNG